MTVLVKSAILQAAEAEGDPTDAGKKGLVNYLRWLARSEPSAFVTLLRKLLPVQIKSDANIGIEVLAALRGGSVNGHAPPILDLQAKTLPRMEREDD